jgi:hypothetical protein
MDYSFTKVNQHSIPLAPDSMQIGHTLHRLLQNIAYANPKFGPPLLCKYDLSNGYYRVRLTPEAALELAVVIPGFSPNYNLCLWAGDRAHPTFAPLPKPSRNSLMPPFNRPMISRHTPWNSSLRHTRCPLTPLHRPYFAHPQRHCTNR